MDFTFVIDPEGDRNSSLVEKDVPAAHIVKKPLRSGRYF
jgi:hypothetical protein